MRSASGASAIATRRSPTGAAQWECMILGDTTRRVREGLPLPRGAHWDGEGTNFALFSANATKVEVCLFDSDGVKEV